MLKPIRRTGLLVGLGVLVVGERKEVDRVEAGLDEALFRISVLSLKGLFIGFTNLVMAGVGLALDLSFRFRCAMAPPTPPPIAPPMTRMARTINTQNNFLLYICFRDNTSYTCGCSDHTLGLKHFSGSFTTSGELSERSGELCANWGASDARLSWRIFSATNAAFSRAALSSISICDMAIAMSGRKAQTKNLKEELWLMTGLVLEEG